MVILVKLLAKYIIIIYALGFWYMKSLVSKSNTFQSCSTVEIPDWARRKKRLSRSKLK